MAASGLAITHGGHATRLKWHRLRRSRRDPEFSAPVMAAGLREGASMELDLRLRADGGFAVLHDAELDRETTGTGPVAASTGDALAGLLYRQSGLPLMRSEDLAALLPAAHPEALLQFDMKDGLAMIGARGLDHLAEHFGRSAAPIIFSGGCPDLIRALAERLPHLRRGIDPTDRLAEIIPAAGPAAAAAALLGELRGGAAPDTCYFGWELLLESRARGLDLVALCHGEGVRVDAWTYTLGDPAAGFSDREWADFAALMALRPDQITTDEALATEAAWNRKQADRTRGA